MDLHGQIMNIQIDRGQLDEAISFDASLNEPYYEMLAKVYRRGHRDARHAAAKLAVENREMKPCE